MVTLNEQTAEPLSRKRIFARGRRLTLVRRGAGVILAYALLILVAVIMLAPLGWMISTAFKAPTEALEYPPRLLPTQLNTESFERALTRLPILRYTANTATVAVTGVVLEMLISSMAAYSFARLRWPGRDKVFFLYLGTMMIPSAVTLIPSFILIKTLGWVDSYQAIVVPTLSSAYSTFLLRQFFLTIPQELEDASRIDGCGRFGFYWRILLPLSIPPLMALGVFSFLGRWNMFLWPYIVLKSNSKFTLQVALAGLRDEMGRVAQVSVVMAITTLAILPVLILFFVAQRYFVKGVVLSGLKG